MSSTQAATVILSESLMPLIKDRHHPWQDPVDVTPEMQSIVEFLLNNLDDTLSFIDDIEGPTDEETILWEAVVSEIMAGLDWE